MMVAEPLDFWNYPTWLGDTRDNPRNPQYEPFWMRPLKITRTDEDRLDAVKDAQSDIQEVYKRIPERGTLIIRNRDGIEIYAIANPGGGFYITPEDEKLLQKEK